MSSGPFSLHLCTPFWVILYISLAYFCFYLLLLFFLLLPGNIPRSSFLTPSSPSELHTHLATDIWSECLLGIISQHVQNGIFLEPPEPSLLPVSGNGTNSHWPPKHRPWYRSWFFSGCRCMRSRRSVAWPLFYLSPAVARAHARGPHRCRLFFGLLH